MKFTKMINWKFMGICLFAAICVIFVFSAMRDVMKVDPASTKMAAEYIEKQKKEAKKIRKCSDAATAFVYVVKPCKMPDGKTALCFSESDGHSRFKSLKESCL